MDQPTLPYEHLIESHIDHLKRWYLDLLSDDSILPQFWFLTATFVPFETKRDDYLSIPPHRCIVLFERFYVRLLSKLMNNFERKRWLQPLTYLYIDYPFTRRTKAFATLLPIEQFRLNQFHFYPGHPETTPHIHSIMLIAPQLVARFNAVAPTLENLFKSLGPANCTLHAVPLQSIDELRNVMFYSSKLLKQPLSVLRGLSKTLWEPRKLPHEPRKSICDIDLYAALPKAKSEPIYVKAKWERELEAALKEARSWVGREPACINTLKEEFIVSIKTQ
jgi:hypothetical protein